MRKIPTLFLRDPENMRHVTDQVHPDCQWVMDGEGTPTRKYDGVCVMLDAAGAWWARREVKAESTPPPGFVPFSTDPVTGKTVGWEQIAQSSFVKMHAEAAVSLGVEATPGTYELCGPRVNRNPEGYERHTLVRHADAEEVDVPPVLSRESLEEHLLAMQGTGIEGVVWHHPDGRMAKLKVRDFT